LASSNVYNTKKSRRWRQLTNFIIKTQEKSLRF